MPHHARYYEPRNERGRLVLLVLIPGVPVYKICSSDFYNREKRNRRIAVRVYDRGLKNCLIVVLLFFAGWRLAERWSSIDSTGWE